MDRHLNRLGHDLEQVDEPGGGGASTSRSSMPGRYSRMRKYWLGFKGEERDKGVKHGGTNDLCITYV